MSVALRGNLRDFGIGEVFQLIGQQRKTGVLVVDGESDRLEVAFLDGAVASARTAGPHENAALGDMLVRIGLLTADRLVAIEREAEAGTDPFRRLLVHRGDLHADQIDEAEDLLARETIFRLLRWSQGSFHFEALSVLEPRPGARLLPAEQILMDGLRMVDEWRTLEPTATRAETIFQRVGRFDAYREASAGRKSAELARSERMFLLIDGRLTARRVIDLSRLGLFEGARILSEMKRAGVIEPLAADAAARFRPKRIPLASAARRGRAQLLTWAPFLALLLVVGAIRFGASAPPAAPSLEIRVDAAARASFEARRLRNLAEAYAFSQGRWPEDLAALAEAGWVSADALAPARGAPYHVAHRDGSLIVLAPEH
ncbi:MAG: DUF4388 domain-containing protein [Myxococcota bacterium]